MTLLHSLLPSLLLTLNACGWRVSE